MYINEIQELAELLNEYGLQELELERDGSRIYLSKGASVAPVTMPVATSVVSTEAPLQGEERKAAGEALKSPLVGVVYLAPSPDQAPFVSVGQSVKKGQTLCILEAMKVMNEFTAPRDGVVLEICVQNEELAQFEQELFRLG